MLSSELSPGLSSAFSPSPVDAEVLSKAVGSAADKRKSVTYAPSVTHSPETLSAVPQSFARPGGAKSMPASRRTSASEHDEELAEHLQGLTLAGEQRAAMAQAQAQAQAQQPQSILRSAGARYAAGDGVITYGMMLDEQLDQEMHSAYQQFSRSKTLLNHVIDAMRHLPTSDEDKFTNGYNKVRQPFHASWLF